ncbi:MAG: PIG-L deacetylase family protein [Limisphaerales bacterium]
MNPYPQFVAEFARLAREGKTLPLGGLPSALRPVIPDNAPKALIFSPHPDDECIIGGLALRLLREAGMRVVNVAVTQGSNPARQAGRLQELRAACDFLGFDLVQTAPHGLEKVSPKTRAADPSTWSGMVEIIARVLATQRPRVIFFPHDEDWNSTHLGVHWLLVDALTRLGPDFACFTVETELWGQCDDPNLAVESSVADLADMVAATSFHVVEVQRNPYHVLLPAWMMDNVRRGGELVGGQGKAAPDMTFATLYRFRRWENGGFQRFYEGGRNLAAGENAGGLFA